LTSEVIPGPELHVSGWLTGQAVTSFGNAGSARLHSPKAHRSAASFGRRNLDHLCFSNTSPRRVCQVNVFRIFKRFQNLLANLVLCRTPLANTGEIAKQEINTAVGNRDIHKRRQRTQVDVKLAFNLLLVVSGGVNEGLGNPLRYVFNDLPRPFPVALVGYRDADLIPDKRIACGVVEIVTLENEAIGEEDDTTRRSLFKVAIYIL